MTSEQAVGTDRESTALEDSGGRPPRRISFRSLFSIMLVATVLIGLVILLNWPYQFTRVASTPSGKIRSAADCEVIQSPMPVMAGWPYRYSIRYAATESGAPEVSRFSAQALALNLSLGGAVALCLMYYLIRRERKHSSRASRLSIADLMVLTLMLAAPFGWWQQAGKRIDRELKLAAMIYEAGGESTLSAWIPEALASWYPESLQSKLRRIHQIRIEHPRDELMSQLVELPELTLLRVGGGDYDLATIQRLVGNPHLVDLRLAGRVLDAPTIHSIAALERLHTLSLMRTNVSAEALQQLDAMPNLQRICLIHSDVVLGELGTPPWSGTIRQLYVGHPDPGDEASLRLEGWPELDTLSINELESQLNSTAMRIELADLPKLQHLYLDVFQKFDLTLRNVPNLEGIMPMAHEWQSRLPRGGSAPGEIWCGRLDIDGAPRLERMSLFALGLKHFRIRNAPKLDWLGVAAFYRTQSAATYASELTKEAATALISGLGESDGPATIDLDAVPLANVDLAPLAKNKRITKLLLSQSGTELKQWKGLEPMKWLVRLDVKGCAIDDDGVQWVLDTFPDLQHFAFSAWPNWNTTFSSSTSGNFDTNQEGASVLEIVDRPKLKTIDLGDSQTEFLSKVRVVNSPHLKLDLALGFVETLEISDAPSLTGLRVSGPLPPDATLSGVRDLQFLVVGGPTVTDSFISGLQDCKSLKTLTLAYPAVTADGLKQLKNLSSLQSLILPGSAVDDQVVAAWPQMPNLEQLDLRDTSITGASLQRLLASGHATRVLLDRTNIDLSDLSILTKHSGLSELSLAGIGIDAKTLAEIFAKSSLVRLNLSNSTLAPEILDAIAENAQSLSYLILRNCDIDDKRLRLIASRNRSLRFDLTGSDVSTELMTALLTAQRVVEQQEWDQQLAMQAMYDEYGNRRPVDPAKLDIHFFAQLAEQMQPGGTAGVYGPTVVLPASSTSFGPVVMPVTPQAPIATRFGQWLGNALLGPAPDDDAETEDDQPLQEAGAGSGSSEQQGLEAGGVEDD